MSTLELAELFASMGDMHVTVNFFRCVMKAYGGKGV
jgi:hypothetical protein